jgi:hypothetical protein
MSQDEDLKNVRLFDVRTVERNIKKGVTTRKDYEKYLKSLQDVSDRVAPPESKIEDADDGDDDDLDDAGADGVGLGGSDSN